MALTWDGRYLWVSSTFQSDSWISKIDIGNYRVLSSVKVPVLALDLASDGTILGVQLPRSHDLRD